jgi:hypothetical protein
MSGFAGGRLKWIGRLVKPAKEPGIQEPLAQQRPSMPAYNYTGPCRICGAAATFTKSALKNNSHHSDPIFNDRYTMTCSECESSWCENCPTEAEIGGYYARTYKVGRISDKDLKKWPVWDTRSTQLITLGRMFGTFKAGQVFLDIGPGHGNALASASQLLPKPRYAVIEFNEPAIAFMRKALGNLAVSHSTRGILKRFGKGGVQFIYSAHCFEHFNVEELRKQLTPLREALADDGVLALEVPQANTEFFNRANNHVPHLIFFSAEGLTSFLKSCGFDVKVCVGTWGQNPRARNFVARTLGKTPASDEYKAKLAALNTGDWIGAKPGLVLKCIATKSAG